MLRLRLAAEHLGRLDRVLAGEELTDVVADCLEPEDMYAAYADCADALDAWHTRGRPGPRPPGQLRRLDVPDLARSTRVWARFPLRVVQDPDGRPWRLPQEPPVLEQTGGSFATRASIDRRSWG